LVRTDKITTIALSKFGSKGRKRNWMFKFFLSRYKSISQRKGISFPGKNAAEIGPLFSSYLTNLWPVGGRIVTEWIIKLVYGNKFLLNLVYQRQKKTVLYREKAGSVLVISDLNIGDALNLQVACQTLRQLFPGKVIHYAINKKPFPLLKGNPDIDEIFPVFSGSAIPDAGDVYRLKELVHQHGYDLIINFCPFFIAEMFSGSHAHFLNHYALTMGITYTELKTGEVNHLRKKIFDYLTHLFPEETAKNEPVLKDVPIYIDKKPLEQARSFLIKNNLYGKSGIVMLNPDATSPYTKFPLDMQLRLLKRLLAYEGVNHLLLGSGFVFKGVENEILKGLENEKGKEKIILLPKSFSLETYAAILDSCDVYITNDTGPLHLAAARKWDSEGNLLRNKTAIFSIFGATPARIYAYDSEDPCYFPAPQDAPSHVFVSKSPCRNITCINKLSKKCKTIRCFDGLVPEEMADKIISYLKELLCT